MTSDEIAVVRGTLEAVKGYFAAKRRADSRDGVPGASAILNRALAMADHADAWEDGTLSDDARREVLGLIALEGRERLRLWAEELVLDVGPDETKALFGAVRAKVGAFFDRAGSFVRELFAAGALAVIGPQPLSEAEQDALDRGVEVQMEYLEDFKRQVVGEQRPLGGQFAARAAMYGSAVWGNVLEVQRQGIIAVGAKTEEMRVLGQAEEHCESTPEQAGCVELANRRWVKIGSSPRIGDTPCKSGCRCHFEYR